MKRKYWILLISCVVVLFLDQWTKYLVLEKFPLYSKEEIIRGFFYLVHVTNTGGAFGIFGGERGGLISFMFIPIALIAIGVIIYLYTKIKENEQVFALALSLILSGAIGNLTDRLRYGEVIDFLQFYLPFIPIRLFNPWPTFNIADSAICIGIGLMMLELLIHDKKKKGSKT